MVMKADGDAERSRAKERPAADAPTVPETDDEGTREASVRENKRQATASRAERASADPALATLGVQVPSIPPPPVAGPWRSYKEIVATLSNRIVEAQKPIRVLNSIKWDPGVWERFRASRYRDVPSVGPDWYAQLDLGFDPRQKAVEFEEILRDIEKNLPANDDVAEILSATARQYRDVVCMLEARGTPGFYAYARRLYGSPKDKYPDGKTTVRDSALVLYQVLTTLPEELGGGSARDITASKAVDILNARLIAYFGDGTVRVAEDDGIFADAAAGSDYVKIRRGAMFSLRDIDLFEVHEGWVHLATSLNGQAQTVATWLGKGPPRTTAAQEGLAALMEIFTFRTYPRRARRLNDRVLAVDKAEDGADFAQIFDWYRTEGYDEDDCFNATRRVFRGGTTTGGAPFTKDICYSKGIVLNYAFIRACIEHDRPELIPFLFVGKIAHEDVPVLFARTNDGVVRPPKYLPQMFRDLNGLAIWMSYSTFFTRLAGAEVSEHYARLFRKGSL
jgi:uncharacterized protein (TIGR02421 family)